MESLLTEKTIIPILAFLVGLFIRKFVNPYLAKLKVKREHFDLIEDIARKIAVYFMTTYPEQDWHQYIGKAIEILIGSIKIDKKEEKSMEIAKRELTDQFQLLSGDEKFMKSLKKVEK